MLCFDLANLFGILLFKNYQPYTFSINKNFSSFVSQCVSLRNICHQCSDDADQVKDTNDVGKNNDDELMIYFNLVNFLNKWSKLLVWICVTLT